MSWNSSFLPLMKMVKLPETVLNVMQAGLNLNWESLGPSSAVITTLNAVIPSKLPLLPTMMMMGKS